jgi:hypothetical protein
MLKEGGSLSRYGFANCVNDIHLFLWEEIQTEQNYTPMLLMVVWQSGPYY